MEKHEKEINILALLNKALSWAIKSKLYREKLAGATLLDSLSSFSKIPFTTKQELREWYPYGNLATDFSNVVEMHMTSGTTGRPTLSFYTKKDLETSSAAIAKAWKNFGIDRTSRVQFMMSYGLFSGAPLNTYAIQSLGAFVLPAGIQPASKQIQLLKDFEIDTIVATPSYYLYLYDYLQQNSIPIKDLNLKRGIAAGEAYSDEMKRKISHLFSMPIYDHYGLCEVNTGIIYECKKCGGMAVLDEYVYPEIIDPVNCDLLTEGKAGELVLTALNKEASPIIRYRTGDMTSIKTFFSDCPECYGSVVLDRIKLRYDSTIFYKGVKIEPIELRDMIICFAGEKMYSRVRIRVNENPFLEHPKILLSLKSESDKRVLDELGKHLKEKTGVTFEIQEVSYSYFDDFHATKDKIVEYVK